MDPVGFPESGEHIRRKSGESEVDSNSILPEIVEGKLLHVLGVVLF